MDINVCSSVNRFYPVSKDKILTTIVDNAWVTSSTCDS